MASLRHYLTGEEGGGGMAKKIMVGTEDFDELILSGGYYVDKTDFLYELVEETSNKVTLFTRPRRFGKTLTLSMIQSFFDVTRDSHDVFAGLAITKDHPEFCDEWMNQYPTIFVSLKDVEGLTFEAAFESLKSTISRMCIRIMSLSDGKAVDPADKEAFLRLANRTGAVDEVKTSLDTIMRMMAIVYGKPVIVLIDEYDVPLEKAYSYGYYWEMVDVMRAMMSTALKTNSNLKVAVVTGCLRLSKESLFTGVNNFACYSVLDDEFSSLFGFTQKEVDALLSYYGREEKADVVRKWYDGYAFGDTEIYCPWDVVSYVSALRKRTDAVPKAYWAHTSGNDVIEKLFEMEDVDVSVKLEALLNREEIVETMIPTLTYEEAYRSESNLWSMLLMAGYLTSGKTEDDELGEDEEKREVTIRIPNAEIASLFKRAVVDHFKKAVDEDEKQISELMRALWEGDERKASEVLSDLLWGTISFMDYHEDYYHAFLTGIFVGRGGYAVKTTKERGLGGLDVEIRDKTNRRAIIIEAKKAEAEDRMGYWCEEGIRQIEEKGYAGKLDGYREIWCYGVSFFKKNVLVKKDERLKAFHGLLSNLERAKCRAEREGWVEEDEIDKVMGL